MEMNYKKLIKNQTKHYIFNIEYWIFLLLAVIFIAVMSFNLILYEPLFLIVIGIYFSYCIYRLVENIDYLVALRKYNKKISQSDIDLINEELKNVISYNGAYLFTENYVFFLQSRFSIFKYQDVIFIDFKTRFSTRPSFDYIRIQAAGFFLYKSLYVILKSGKKYYFDLRKDEYYSKNFINTMLDKNSDIMVGKTKANKEIMLEKYGIKI